MGILVEDQVLSPDTAPFRYRKLLPNSGMIRMRDSEAL